MMSPVAKGRVGKTQINSVPYGIVCFIKLLSVLLLHHGETRIHRWTPLRFQTLLFFLFVVRQEELAKKDSIVQ